MILKSRFSDSKSAKRKAAENVDRYFFDDDDGDSGGPVQSSNPAPSTTDGDEDPLDAFMAEVEKVRESEKRAEVTTMPLAEIVSDDLNCGDYEAEEARWHSEDSDEDATEYNSDGEPVTGSDGKVKSKVAPLAPVDHSAIDYRAFRKNFYKEHTSIQDMSERDVSQYLEEHELAVLDSQSRRFKPVDSFQKLGFPTALVKEIMVNRQFERPTAVQSLALPIALSGRDMIALAKTGSGKTMAYVWPMIVHILDQPQMKIGDGPIGVILAPTRELATQIYSEANKFAKCFNIRVCAVFGGGGKWEMKKALKEAPEMVVATPGRFIDLLSSKDCTNLSRCTMIVLDEADRMFDMGFEYQVRSIMGNIRRDRQTLMFSATMKKKVEVFAREVLCDPVRITVGSIGQANPDICQTVLVLSSDNDKWGWLADELAGQVVDRVAGGEIPKVLVFVSSKAATEELRDNLRKVFGGKFCGHNALYSSHGGIEALHGDMDQTLRDGVMRRFKSGDVNVLVATDVASRGLDVKNIRTVVNYDLPKNIETYVHRIGRTGRMGVDGVTPGRAITLLTTKDSSFAVDLMRNLELSKISVSPDLQRLAQTDPRFGRRHVRGHGHGGGGASAGIGSAGASRAMTSAMMAMESAAYTSSPSSSSSKFTSGGMKQVPETATPSFASRHVGRTASVPSQRFSASSSAPASVPQHYSSTSTVLSGFVRSSSQSSSTLTSVQPTATTTSQTESAPATAPVRKRSRWDA